MKRGLPLDVEKIADVLAVQVVAATRPLLDRLKALEAREQAHLGRIAELEGRKIPEPIDPVGAVAKYFEENPLPAPGISGEQLTAATDPLAELIRRIEVEQREQRLTIDTIPRAAPPPVDPSDAVAEYLAAHPPAPGKNADPVTDAQLADVVAKHLDANPSQPIYAPDDVADMIAKAVATVAEAPAIVPKAATAPITVNISQTLPGPDKPRTVNKSVKTSRDLQGNLVAEVTETAS